MKIHDIFARLLFPSKCVFCNAVLKSGDLCIECEKTLPYTKGEAVSQKFPFIQSCVSPLYYKDNVRLSIHRYKFGGCSAYCSRYGRLVSDCVQKALALDGIDMVSWIPLSKRRLRRRGYDQAQLMAERLAEGIGKPCAPTLIKSRDNKAQSTTRSVKERRDNVAGAYELLKDAEVSGRRILLVDDVVTTGSTLSEAARVLRKAGAKSVFAATLARHED